MKKWFPIFIIFSSATALAFFNINIPKLYASNGSKIFKVKGCASCHYTNKGKDKKPYPTKQILANIKFSDFKNTVKNGKPGTAMPAYKNLSDEEINTIYNWLQKYK